jgi:hypothetical protein
MDVGLSTRAPECCVGGSIATAFLTKGWGWALRPSPV